MVDCGSSACSGRARQDGLLRAAESALHLSVVSTLMNANRAILLEILLLAGLTGCSEETGSSRLPVNRTFSVGFSMPETAGTRCEVYFTTEARTARYEFEPTPERRDDPVWICLKSSVGPLPTSCTVDIHAIVWLEFEGAEKQALQAWLGANVAEGLLSCGGTIRESWTAY
jgi:hypothetical protein